MRPHAPYLVQRGLTNDFAGVDRDGWHLGGQAAAPLARKKLVATLAAETAAALG